MVSCPRAFFSTFGTMIHCGVHGMPKGQCPSCTQPATDGVLEANVPVPWLLGWVAVGYMASQDAPAWKPFMACCPLSVSLPCSPSTASWGHFPNKPPPVTVWSQPLLLGEPKLRGRVCWWWVGRARQMEEVPRKGWGRLGVKGRWVSFP